ncbi:hypothetical protein [Myxacorys almedinensis]|uniref:Uncharacterized protein n=1 Tax=Myxacorys almedinensis A TaxID=2690445 RepID=A0A8J8CL30_9CYAN|nr:hypothetical protein [Myxacorys almedinensis]NDJ17285.1 hypothetical protein [Myxacorys almedinensis A]
MQSTDLSSAGDRDSLRLGFIPSGLVLSAATVPVLVGLVSAQALASAIADIGAMSEEIFRGDRLPTLDFSEASAAPSPDQP